VRGLFLVSAWYAPEHRAEQLATCGHYLKLLQNGGLVDEVYKAISYGLTG
jgi:hypothetical protein